MTDPTNLKKLVRADKAFSKIFHMEITITIPTINIVRINTTIKINIPLSLLFINQPEVDASALDVDFVDRHPDLVADLDVPPH